MTSPLLMGKSWMVSVLEQHKNGIAVPFFPPIRMSLTVAPLRSSSLLSQVISVLEFKVVRLNH